jgi:general stress protein 26
MKINIVKNLLNVSLLLLTNTLIVSCQQSINYSEIEIKRDKKASDPIVEVEKGDLFKLSGSIEFSNGEVTTDVIWESLTPNIVKIEDDGKIKALEAGDGQLKITSKKDSTKSSIIKVKVLPFKEIETKITDGSEKLNELFGNELKDFKLPEDNKSIIKPSTSPTPTPKPTINYTPVLLEGRVYDSYGSPVSDAKVSIRNLDKNFSYSDKNILTVDGFYSFKDVPFETLLEVNVTKDGWTSRKRVEVIKNKEINTINFGESDNDLYYAIQDEPEIVALTLNQKKVSYLYKEDFSLNDEPQENEITSNKINSNTSRFEFSTTFSEPIDTDSFEDSTEVICLEGEKFSKNNKLSFSWSTDSKTVSFYGYLNSNKTKDICKLQFNGSFRDKSGNNSITNKYINFAPNILGDYVYFSK